MTSRNFHLPAFPEIAITAHDVDDREQCGGASIDSDFEWFLIGAETFVEFFDYWVMAGGAQRRHIEHAAQAGPAAVDMASAALLATVTIEWRDAHQFTNLLATNGPQLRQVSHDGE